MAEPPDLPADPVAAAEGRDVWSTRLHVPRPPPTFVARPRLAERLDRSPPRSLTLVSAPAGFGKSVLVADWCRHRPGPVAWLSLDPGDNDPVRFWRHVAAALDHADITETASLEARLDRVLRRSRETPLDELAAMILDGVAETSDEVVLVLDDVHVVTDGDVHASIRLLIDRAPDQLRVVLVSRSDPPVKLARRRARGELTEIRADDLRFRPDEAGDLLGAAIGARLAEDAVSTLTERTEGWAAGLQLAGLSLEGRDDVASFLSNFSGSHRFVLDYLTEEVLDRQPAPMQEFLLRTSVLQRLSGPLCDAVTGGSDGQERLEACERANLFLVPLDDDRRWWRYHHLFGDLLRVRLQRRSPDLVGELHRRAAAWYEEQGLADQAIGHALDAGEPGWAARLIERHADELLLRREGATLHRHLSDLPDDAMASRRLVLARARTAVYAGRPAEAERLIDAATASPTSTASTSTASPASVTSTASPSTAEADDEPFEPSVDRSASPLAELEPTTTLLRAFIAHLRGHADEAIGLATRSLTEIDEPGSALELIAGWHLATGPWLRGDVEAAEAAVSANIERWRAAGDHDRAAWASHHLGRIQREHGDLDAAVETYGRVLSIDAAGGSPTAGVAHVGLAEIAYERDDLEAARHHAEQAIVRGRHFVFTQVLSSALAVRARILRADGDPDGARAAMEEAVEVGPDPDVADLLNPVPVDWARFLLDEGDEGPAAYWTELRGVCVDDEPSRPVEPAHLLLARLLIARGHAADAVPLLDRIQDAATEDGRQGSLVEIEALRAIALAEVDRSAALSALDRAVAVAAPPCFVRVFLDEGDTMATLLGELAAIPTAGHGTDSGAGAAHLARLVRAFDRDTVPGTPARQPLVVPLTERELEVLRELATGKQNREIAAELYVSLNTVKKHITHIFDKLGVSNRTAAIARARDLGL